MQESTSDKFIRGLSIQTLVSISNAITQVIVFAILSRLLSREDFGYYAALMGITLIFYAISDAGIGSAVIQKKDLDAYYESTAFTLSLILGLLIGFFFFLLSSIMADIILDDTLYFPLQLMTIPLVLHGMNGYAVGILRRNLKFGLLGTYKLISYILASSVAVYLAWKGFGLYSMIVLFVLDALIYTSLLYTKVKIPKLGLNKRDSKGVLSFGGWLTMGVIMSSLSNQIDKLVLGKWLSVVQLGAYNRPAGFISNIIAQINGIFDSVLFPILSAFQDSKEKFRELFYESYKLLSTFGIMLACVLMFNSELIIRIFFGEQWFDLVPVLRIISLTAIFMLNNTLADCFIRSFNLVKAGFYIRLFGVIISSLFIYFGSRFDILGVAVAVFVSNLFIVLTKILYLSKKSEASMGYLVSLSFLAWYPSLPIILIGGLCMFFPPELPFQVLRCIVILFVVGIELFLFPSFVGDEYNTLIYRKIPFLKKK